METNTDPVSREVHDVYIAKINNLVAEGRESLIAALVADYDQIRREESIAEAA